MKKILSLVVVLLLCASLVLPVFAAEDNFVPSITYKPNPEIISLVGEDGESYIGVIRNGDGEILSTLTYSVKDYCLRAFETANDANKNMIRAIYAVGKAAAIYAPLA